MCGLLFVRGFTSTSDEKIDFRFLFQLKHGLAYFTQQLEKEFRFDRRTNPSTDRPTQSTNDRAPSTHLLLSVSVCVFSAENIHFWKEVAAFRQWCNANDGANAANDKPGLQSRAKAIADTFVRTSAASQVNLRSDVMEAVLQEVDSGTATATVFNGAQQEIFNLLERDSFPRFKSSQLFVAMMEEYGITVTVKKPGEGNMGCVNASMRAPLTVMCYVMLCCVVLMV